MGQEHRPIKRSAQLAPLSREHHEALLFVWKIKQGIALNIPAQTIGKYCDWFWQNFLNPHFDKEEKSISRLLAPSDSLLNTMTEDHEVIREKMQQVIDDPSHHSIERLAQIIYYHVRFEERDLFTHAEQLHPEKLDEALQILVATNKNDNTWADEFWLKKSDTCELTTKNSCQLTY